MLRSRVLRTLPYLATTIAVTAFMALPATAQKRVALVIGNSAYQHATALANPVNDANDMGAALKELGFEVILGLDLDKRAFDARVREFSRALPDAETGVFYYAGHGLQLLGRNYLVPIDAQLQSERDLDFEASSLDFILKQMELDRDGKTSIVFLDACRDNPLAGNLARSMGTRSAGVGRGLAQVQAGVGTFVAYSTQPGNVALDGQDRNSPFTAALATSIKEPGRNLTSVMIDVRKKVLAATNGRQVPWDHSALTGDFYFHLASAPGTVPKVTPPDSSADAMRDRVRQLEEELKNRPDQRQTANIARLEQLNERLRRLEQENRDDQQRIFDTYRKQSSTNDANARMAISREVGNIQMQIARRGQEQAKVREEIARLTSETGALPSTKAAQ
jgi:hypothetical protein